MNTLTANPDYTAIKTRQQATWASGDYALIGTTLQIAGENLAEAMDMPPGARVLDVAAGNGNVSLAMARRLGRVTSTDYVPELLEKGRRRAEAEDLNMMFETADAEALPFADGAFDAVVSTFGVMFAPDQKTAAAEMIRVCRSGGKIGMANWMPDGFIGQMFKTIGKHVAPPKGVNSPAMWGNPDWIGEQFRAHANSFVIERRAFVFRYPSPEHMVDHFRTYYGPVHKAFMALDAKGQAALEADLLALIASFNMAKDGSMRVPSDYAEIVIVKA
ncbi:MAG: class I SAM-dependent methyltransferase [Aestuariivirga sp.]